MMPYLFSLIHVLLVCSINVSMYYVSSHILHKAIVGQEVTKVNNYYLVVPEWLVLKEMQRE